MGMCVQYGDGKKRRKPNYSSVDLSEVEWEDKDDTVRLLYQIYIKHHHSSPLKKKSPNKSDVLKSGVCASCCQLRNAMVNRKTGTFSMEVKKSVDKGVRRPTFRNVHTTHTHTNERLLDCPRGGEPEKILNRENPLCQGGCYTWHSHIWG